MSCNKTQRSLNKAHVFKQSEIKSVNIQVPDLTATVGPTQLESDNVSSNQEAPKHLTNTMDGVYGGRTSGPLQGLAGPALGIPASFLSWWPVVVEWRRTTK